jgi:hypothetical protein
MKEEKTVKEGKEDKEKELVKKAEKAEKAEKVEKEETVKKEEKTEEVYKTIESPTIAAPTNSNGGGKAATSIAVVALVVAFGLSFFNYVFTNSVRSEIQEQNLDLEKFQASIEKLTSSMKAKVDKNRQLLDTQIASSTEKFEKQRIQMENQRSQTEKMHLTMGFGEIVKDLRPVLEIYCQDAKIRTAKVGANTVPIDCSFKNIGNLKANIVPDTLIMLGGKDYSVIDSAIERIDNGEKSSVSPGKTSRRQYYVVLTKNGAANIKNAAFKISFRAFTDASAIEMIKRRTNKAITDKELEELSEKSYTFTFQP